MRLAALALTAAVALLLFSASVAFAAKAGCVHDRPCFGSSAGDRIMGTNGEDRIMARSGRDYVDARGGSDVVHGESGSDGDEYAAGGLLDHIQSVDGRMDVIDCGGGKDAVWFDEGLDIVSPNCELRNIIHSGR